ncbi:mediator of RNA polymerase II transcription subunit 12-like [Haliotis rufescens]|uniref:mediator of RNA polymerase II transcription subunit 12-like n=1 Tax=Haliotis rufescens TaxID=6454 RepID=UPI00201F153B|nr:mediator of RNA polymerase II transcription subunit 12-like [Haliotis rufescens]
MDVPVGADTFYGPTPPPYQQDITRRPYVNNGPNDPGAGAQYEPRPQTGLGQEMTRPLYQRNGPVGHPDNAGTSGSKTFLNSAQPGTEQMYPPKGPAGQPKNGVPGAGNIEAVFPRGMSSVPLRKEPRVSGPRIKVVESLSPAEFSVLEKDASGVAGKKLGGGTFPPGMSLSNDLRVPIQTTPSPVNTFRKNVPNKIPLKRMVDPAQYLEKSKANLGQTGTSVSVNNRPNADPNYASGYTKPAEEPQSQIKHVVVSLAASSSSRLSSSPLRLRHNEKGEIIHPSTSGSNTQQKFLGNNAPNINTAQNQGPAQNQQQGYDINRQHITTAAPYIRVHTKSFSKPIIRFSGLKTQTPRPSFRSRSVTVRAPLSRPGFKKAPLFRVRQTNTSSLPYRPRFLRRRGPTATENDRSSTMPASSAAQSPARVQSRVPTPQTAATSPKTHLPNYRPRSPVPRVGTNVGNQPPLPQTPTDSMREYRKTPNLNIKPEPQSPPSNQGIHAPSQDSPGYQQAQGTQSSYQSRLQNNQQQANTKPSVQTLGPQPPRKITFTLRRFSGGFNTKKNSHPINNKPSVPQSSYNNPSLQKPQNPPPEINAYNSQSNPQTSNTYDNPQKTQQNVPSNIQQPSSYQQSQSLSNQQQQPSSYNKQAIAPTPKQVVLPKPSQSSGYQTNNNPDPPQQSQNFNTQGQNVQSSIPAFQQAPGSVPQSKSWKPETGQGSNINMPAASLTSYQSGSGTSYQAPKHPTPPQKQQVGYQQQPQQQQQQQQQQGGYQHQSQQQMPGQQQLSHQPQQKQGYQKQSQQQQQHGGYQQQQQQNQESYQSKSRPTPQQNQHTGSNNGLGQPAFMQVNTNTNNNVRSGNQGTGYGSAGGLVQTQNSQTNQARSMSQGALKEVVSIFNQQGQQLHGQVKPQGQTGATAYGQSANNQPGMQNQNSLATNTGATRSSGYSNTGSQGQGLAQSVNTQPSMQNQSPINSARAISYGGQQGQMPIQSSAGGSGQKLSQSLGQPNIGPNNQAGVSTSYHIQGQSQIAVKPGSTGQSGQGQGVSIQGTVQHGSQGQNPQTGIGSNLGGSPLNQGAINYPGLSQANTGQVGNSMSTQTNQGMQNGVNQGMQNGVNQGMQNGVNQGMQNGVNQGMQNGVNQGMLNGANQGMQNGVNQGMQNGANQGMQNGINQGMQNGVNQGMQNGVNQGMQNGANQGMQNGINQGMQSGVNQGMQNGVNQGMQNGVNQGMQNGANQGLQSGVNQGMQNGANQGMQNGINQGMHNGVNQGIQSGVNQGIQNGAKQVQNGINQGVSGGTVQSFTGGTQLNTAGGTLQGGVGTVGVGGQMNIGTQGGVAQNSMSATQHLGGGNTVMTGAGGGGGGGMATGGTMTGPGRVRDLVLPYRNKGAAMLGAEPISFEVGVGGRMVMDPTDALRYKAQGGLLPINGMPGSQGANAQQVIHLEGQPVGNMFAQPANGVAQRATAGNVGVIGTVRSQATVNLPSPPGTVVVAGQQNNQQQIITNQKPATQITFRGKRSTNTEFFSKYNLKPTRA